MASGIHTCRFCPNRCRCGLEGFNCDGCGECQRTDQFWQDKQREDTKEDDVSSTTPANSDRT